MNRNILKNLVFEAFYQIFIKRDKEYIELNKEHEELLLIEKRRNSPLKHATIKAIAETEGKISGEIASTPMTEEEFFGWIDNLGPIPIEEVGLCTECFEKLTTADSMSEIGYPDIYECPNCGHPNGPIKLD